jgi:hypothetical protein
MKTFLHLWQYLAKFFLEWEMYYTKFVGKIKHILCSIIYFRKSCYLLGNLKRCGGARGAADNMAYTPWMLDKEGYTPPCTHPRP